MSKREDGGLGQRLRDLREQRGMSLQALATASGVTKTYLWSLERGKHSNPTVAVAKSLASALGVTAESMLGLLDVPAPMFRDATLRDWFAGTVQRPNFDGWSNKGLETFSGISTSFDSTGMSDKEIGVRQMELAAEQAAAISAKLRYIYADAMLKERAK